VAVIVTLDGVNEPHVDVKLVLVQVIVLPLPVPVTCIVPEHPLGFEAGAKFSTPVKVPLTVPVTVMFALLKNPCEVAL
jgi:hypothetical protein